MKLGIVGLPNVGKSTIFLFFTQIFRRKNAQITIYCTQNVIFVQFFLASFEYLL